MPQPDKKKYIIDLFSIASNDPDKEAVKALIEQLDSEKITKLYSFLTLDEVVNEEDHNNEIFKEIKDEFRKKAFKDLVSSAVKCTTLSGGNYKVAIMLIIIEVINSLSENPEGFCFIIEKAMNEFAGILTFCGFNKEANELNTKAKYWSTVPETLSTAANCYKEYIKPNIPILISLKKDEELIALRAKQKIFLLKNLIDFKEEESIKEIRSKLFPNEVIPPVEIISTDASLSNAHSNEVDQPLRESMHVLQIKYSELLDKHTQLENFLNEILNASQGLEEMSPTEQLLIIDKLSDDEQLLIIDNLNDDELKELDAALDEIKDKLESSEQGKEFEQTKAKFQKLVTDTKINKI